MKRYYCGRIDIGLFAEGDRCEECGALWLSHREIDATACGSFVRCRRCARDRGHHCDLTPGHTGPHHTAGCDGGAT